MISKLKIFLASWKTSVPALLAMVCATDSVFFQSMPDAWEDRAGAVCALLLAFGLLAAKDADKTNAKDAVALHRSDA